jgi:hypothetical protein
MQPAAAQADNPDAHQALRDSWTTFNQYLTIHHTAEDEALWPPMRAKLRTHGQELGVLDEMLDEHSQLEPLLREIDNALHQSPPADLAALFGELTDVLVSHFEHEEAAALPLVQQTLSAREWDDFSDDQRNRIGLGAGWFFPWLLDDAPPDMRKFALTLIPPPVRLAYKMVWEPRYRRRSPWRRIAAVQGGKAEPS